MKLQTQLFLNVLRVISAQCVLVMHGVDILFPKVQFENNFKHLASLSVIVFFVISGFLISLSASRLKQKQLKFKDFFIARFARIYSALIPSLIIVFIFDMLTYFLSDSNLIRSIPSYLLDLPVNLLMLQEFPIIEFLHYRTSGFLNKITDFNFFGTDLPLWTLSIEWWLYMSFGWLYFPLNHKGVKYFLILSFFLIVPIHQLIIGSRMGPIVPIFWISGSIYFFYLRSNNLKLPMKFILLLIFAILISTISLFQHLDFLGISILFTITILLTLGYLEKNNFRINNFLNKINLAFDTLASYSFTLYLIHFSILVFFSETWVVDEKYQIYQLLISFLSINILAFLVSRIFEIHHAKFKYWVTTLKIFK